jgi:hypothetical protein
VAVAVAVAVAAGRRAVAVAVGRSRPLAAPLAAGRTEGAGLGGARARGCLIPRRC